MSRSPSRGRATRWAASSSSRTACCSTSRGSIRSSASIPRAGIVHAGAGIEWATLVPGLIELQGDAPGAWGIRQKQSGADGLSLGGALGSNVHGRGLTMRPIVDDVEWFDLVDADAATSSA